MKSRHIMAVLVVLLTLSFAMSSVDAKIVFSARNDQKLVELYNKILDAFREEYPEIEVVFEPLSGLWYEQFTIRLMGGIAPDVMASPVPEYRSFILDGIVAPLDDYEFDMSAHIPLVVNDTTYEGKLYGIGFYIIPRAWVYNADLFQEAGVPFPDLEFTWDDIVSYGTKLTVDRTGDGVPEVYAVNNYGIATWTWEPILVSFGGSMFNDYLRPTEFTMNQPGAMRGMQFYVDLSVVHGVAPRLAPGQGQNLLNIAAGNVAMAGEGAPPTLKPPKYDYDIRIMASPLGPNGRYIRAALEVLWIPSVSQNKEEAWKLIEFMAGPVAQRILAEEYEGALPVSIDTIIEYMNPEWPIHLILEESTTMTSSAPMAQIGPILEREIGPVYWGTASLDSVIMKVKPAIDAILQGQ